MLVNESYYKLRNCGIDDFAMNTDASVIRSLDLEKRFMNWLNLAMVLALGGNQKMTILLNQVVHYNRKRTMQSKLND